MKIKPVNILQLMTLKGNLLVNAEMRKPHLTYHLAGNVDFLGMSAEVDVELRARG